VVFRLKGSESPAEVKKRWVRAVMVRLLVYPSIAYAVLGGWLYLEQGELLFPAPKTYAKLTPAALGLEFEDLRISVKSGGSLHAWWIPRRNLAEKVLIAFHGNGYVLEDMLASEVERLYQAGANLLLIDYRGYGSSSPIRPDETTITEDADATLDYVLHQRAIPPSRVFALGRSIGTGPATHLASANPRLGGLILESPFTSIDDVATSAGPWWFQIYPIPLMLRTHFDNFAGMPSVTTPSLLIAGTADTLTPPWMAKALFRRAQGPKQIYFVPGAGHNDLVDMGGAALTEVLRRFLERY
jgi:uncharacterized protein